MPEARYVGPFDAVILPDLGIEVVQGAVIDVDDLTHANLVAQTDWEDATRPAKAPRPANAARPARPRARAKTVPAVEVGPSITDETGDPQ